MDKQLLKIQFEDWTNNAYVRDFYAYVVHESERIPDGFIKERANYCERILRDNIKPSSVKAHGITMDEYIDLCEKNKFACESCGIPYELIDFVVHIDHDHSSPKGSPNSIRGIICRPCNLNLYTTHNIEMIRTGRALEYLNGEGDNYTFNMGAHVCRMEQNLEGNPSLLNEYGVPVCNLDLNENYFHKYNKYLNIPLERIKNMLLQMNDTEFPDELPDFLLED